VALALSLAVSALAVIQLVVLLVIWLAAPVVAAKEEQQSVILESQAELQSAEE
tara:strand:+ start:1091 stop:1249 length:159 start_codon:yes stop_codon:yes gene_type:complete